MNNIKNFYSTKRMQKIAISLLVVILVIGGIAFAMFSTPTTSSKADVSLTLTSKDIKDDVNTIVNADIEIIKDKTSIEKVSIAVNKAMVLGVQLEAGEYTIKLTSAPITSDGSTYKIAAKMNSITISKKDLKQGKKVVCNIQLERISAESMTKEQLADVIARISKEAPDKNKDLIDTLKKRQETVVSGEVKADAQKAEDATKADTPKAEDTTTPEASANNNAPASSNAGNISSKHVHNWVEKTIWHPAIKSTGHIVVTPAVTKDTVYFEYTDGGVLLEKIVSTDTEAQRQYEADNPGFTRTTVTETSIITHESYHWVEDSPFVQEYNETVYTCSCGATK